MKWKESVFWSLINSQNWKSSVIINCREKKYLGNFHFDDSRGDSFFLFLRFYSILHQNGFVLKIFRIECHVLDVRLIPRRSVGRIFTNQRIFIRSISDCCVFEVIAQAWPIWWWTRLRWEPMGSRSNCCARYFCFLCKIILMRKLISFFLILNHIISE